MTRSPACRSRAALRIVLVTVPRVSRSCEHFPDGFDLHLLHFPDGFDLHLLPRQHLLRPEAGFDDEEPSLQVSSSSSLLSLQVLEGP